MVDRKLQVWKGKLLTRPYGDSWKLAAHPYCCCFPFCIKVFVYQDDQDPPAGVHGDILYQSVSHVNGPFIWCGTDLTIIYQDGECWRILPGQIGSWYAKLYWCTTHSRWEFMCAWSDAGPGFYPNLCKPVCIPANWKVHIEVGEYEFDMIEGGSLFYDDDPGVNNSTALLYPCIGPLGDCSDCDVHYPMC